MTDREMLKKEKPCRLDALFNGWCKMSCGACIPKQHICDRCAEGNAGANGLSEYVKEFIGLKHSEIFDKVMKLRHQPKQDGGGET